MPITVVFDPPLPSDSPEVFNSKAFSTLGDLNDWSTEANALASDVTAKQTTASDAATTATTQAGIATSAASTASTKASEAVNARDVAVQAASDAEAAAAAAALFDPANYVAKAGSTMTGPLSVPAGASGAQVPQAQEIAGLVRAMAVGTVSQSGGVPTGAIIERGSNANGTYIRWADGTQLCICTPVSISTSTSVSPIARGSSGVITYPASFSAVFGTFTSATSGASGSGISAVVEGSPGLSSVAELRGWGVNTSQTTTATLTVIGRWF